MITQAELREALEYRDGLFYWKVKASNGVKPGERAGFTVSKGYWRLGLKSKVYSMQHLVWLYHRGVLSEKIRFRNKNGLDCRIENLELKESDDAYGSDKIL